MNFFPTATQKAPCGPEPIEADGKRYIYAIAHGALTAKTPYLVILNEFGNVTIAVADGAFYCYVAFPNENYASGALAKLQIGGLCEDAITPSITSAVGYAVKLHNALIALVSADYTGAVAEFASLTEVSTATTHDLILCGHMVLTST